MPAEPVPIRPLLVRGGILLVAMGLLDLPLRTPPAPNGIISYEVAFTTDRAAAMVTSWGDSGRLAAGASLLLDYPFLWTYAALLAAFVRRRFGSTGLAPAGITAAWAAAACDAAENVALLRMLWLGVHPGWPLAAGVAASIKFVLLAAVGLLLLWGALTRRTSA